MQNQRMVLPVVETEGLQAESNPRSPDEQHDKDGKFRGFGPSLLHACAIRPLQHLEFPKNLTQARAAARAQIPVCPGVYGWLNKDRVLIYVGKSKSLRHRLVNYFANETSDPKMAKIRRHSHTLVWEPISHELLALIREAELIDRWRPSYNVQGQPERQKPGFICVSRGPAPNLFFARLIPDRARDAFGPFAGRGRLGDAIVSLNYVFGLRDCSDKTKFQFNNQLQLFGNTLTPECIRYELATCPGPCAGNCSRQSYQDNVQAALAFLKGRNFGIVSTLQDRMDHASETLRFERATVVRDQLNHIKWLKRRIQNLTLIRRKLNGVWRLPGFDLSEHAIILRAGQIVACCDSQQASSMAEVLAKLDDETVAIPQSHLGVSLFLMLGSWIRKYPDDVKQILPFDTLKSRPEFNHSL